MNQDLTPGQRFAANQTMRATCPRCGTFAAFRSLLIPPNGQNQQQTFGVIECGFCRGHVAWQGVWEGAEHTYTFSRLIPSAEPTEIADADESIQAALREAALCVDVSAPTAAALVLRRTVQLIARSQNVPKGNLKGEIDALPVSDDLKEIAHSTRIIANEAAHPDPFEWDQVSLNDVRELFDLCIELVNQLYVVPARVRAIRDRAAKFGN